MFFRLFVKLMMLLLVMALAGPFIMKKPDGRPYMTLDQLNLPRLHMPSLPDMPELPGIHHDEQASTPVPAKAAEPAIAWSKDSKQNRRFTPAPGSHYERKAGVFYRFRDANGHWAFADLPQIGVENTVVETDPNANVIQSLSKSNIDKALGREPPPASGDLMDKAVNGGDNAARKQESALAKAIPSTIPVTEIPKLVEQARSVQSMVDQHARDVKNAAGD